MNGLYKAHIHIKHSVNIDWKECEGESEGLPNHLKSIETVPPLDELYTGDVIQVTAKGTAGAGGALTDGSWKWSAALGVLPTGYMTGALCEDSYNAFPLDQGYFRYNGADLCKVNEDGIWTISMEVQFNDGVGTAGGIANWHAHLRTYDGADGKGNEYMCVDFTMDVVNVDDNDAVIGVGKSDFDVKQEDLNPVGGLMPSEIILVASYFVIAGLFLLLGLLLGLRIGDKIRDGKNYSKS